MYSKYCMENTYTKKIKKDGLKFKFNWASDSQPF